MSEAFQEANREKWLEGEVASETKANAGNWNYSDPTNIS